MAKSRLTILHNDPQTDRLPDKVALELDQEHILARTRLDTVQKAQVELRCMLQHDLVQPK